MIAALLLRLTVADRQETALLFVSPDFRATLYANERETIREAKKVAAAPGDASCLTKLICRLAGKPFAVDEFKTGEMIETGRMTRAEMLKAFAARGITTYPNQIMAAPKTSLSGWLQSGR